MAGLNEKFAILNASGNKIILTNKENAKPSSFSELTFNQLLHRSQPEALMV